MDRDGGDRGSVGVAYMQYRKSIHVQWARVFVQVRDQYFPFALIWPHPVPLTDPDNSTRMCISYEFQRFIPHV